MLYNEDKYYVLGYYPVFEKITTFWVDRMGIPEFLDEPAHPKPEGFDPVDYTVNVFSMYDGSTETVELLCENSMMDSVIDRFGDEVENQPVDDEHFRAKAEVSVSQTFFAWIFQFAGHIRLLGPLSVKERYEGMLRDALAGDAQEAEKLPENSD